MSFFKNLFKAPSVKTVLATALTGAATALSHSGAIPVPPSVMDPLLGLVFGWLHLK